MLHEQLRILVRRPVIGVGIEDQLGVRQMLLQDERVHVSVGNWARLGNRIHFCASDCAALRSPWIFATIVVIELARLIWAESLDEPPHGRHAFLRRQRRLGAPISVLTQPGLTKTQVMRRSGDITVASRECSSRSAATLPFARPCCWGWEVRITTGATAKISPRKPVRACSSRVRSEGGRREVGNCGGRRSGIRYRHRCKRSRVRPFFSHLCFSFLVIGGSHL